MVKVRAGTGMDRTGCCTINSIMEAFYCLYMKGAYMTQALVNRIT